MIAIPQRSNDLTPNQNSDRTLPKEQRSHSQKINDRTPENPQSHSKKTAIALPPKQ